MVSVEWLIEVDRKLLPKITETIKGLNGGYLKTIEETKDGVIIAVPINPSEIALPDNVERTPVSDHSVYEKWNEVGDGR